ncbi:hypothetical protein SAMN05216577_1235 [Pseudomonas citronellolis]|uniref:Type 1 fimbrial protein n=1 Tax=Pseudomonas citronellolis TaxID=53408 RepID=A0AAQ1HRS7_9PSED|nr:MULTISPECIES: type 1 fimbrial protein [Pseudomonas]MCL6687792.1 type 1 fimbrial protein [Pseudomonas sp. R3.Fl]MCP1606543.1 hypothetical protein [Pseudomonas citronellolis]MCP1640747.1 hypothetical protein [Pseudomonas citronellolis]MCP1654345.1 hypothetical protein [Pseudomonas citronellolis]MCP1663667.1 hypothetical protein [Pseudomonas citronellolis]
MIKSAFAVLALGLSLSSTAFANGGTISFSGHVYSPPCKIIDFTSQASTQQARLDLAGCGETSRLSFSEPSGQEAARQLAVTDLDGRKVDLGVENEAQDGGMNLVLRNLDGRSGARPLMLNITYL